jgi:hypothetical protein
MPTHSTLPSGQIVFDPRGTLTAASVDLAPRLDTLRGVRVGILDNSKWNASTLLRRVTTLLETGDAPSAVTRYTKDSFSRVAPAELLDRIAAENDAVVTAIGD